MIAFLISVLCISCGLDTYVYLNPVEIVRVTADTWAEIVLPGQSATQYFRNYTIYYRIYLSGTLTSGIIEGPQLNNINPVLANDYSAFAPLTIDDNVSSVSIDSVFRNRKYYILSLRDNLAIEKSLNQILNSPSGTIRLSFSISSLTPSPSLEYPTPSGILYDLWRSNVSLIDRTFKYNEILSYNSDDIQVNPSSGQAYAYVSMYIIATGIDENYSPLYSRPKHIGIFRLPD